MCRNVYLEASGKNPNISIRFLDSDFLVGSKISVIWGRFQSFFSLKKLKVCHISTSGLFDLLT